jgi:hypothetical protein
MPIGRRNAKLVGSVANYFALPARYLVGQMLETASLTDFLLVVLGK